MTPESEIVPWSKIHAACTDYHCDHCGHDIYATSIYIRRVIRENHPKRERRFIKVYREHLSECPSICSENYSRY